MRGRLYRLSFLEGMGPLKQPTALQSHAEVESSEDSRTARSDACMSALTYERTNACGVRCAHAAGIETISSDLAYCLGREQEPGTR